MSRGKTVRLKGTVWQRPNGRWSALTPEVYDARKGRRRRMSLGTFDSEQEGKDALSRWLLNGSEAQAVAPPVRPRTIGAYLHRWLMIDLADEVENGQLRRTTVRDYEQVARNHITPYLGRLDITALDSRVLRDWLTWLRKKGLSDRTVEKVYRVLHRAFEDSDLSENPIWLPKKHRPKVRHRREVVRPDVNDTRAFLSHVAQCDKVGAAPLAPLWRLMTTTGMRRSEACGLTWGDLEEGSGGPLLLVRRGLHFTEGAFHINDPKSKEGLRTVSLDKETAAALRAYREATADRTPVKVNSMSGLVELDLIFRWGTALGPLNPDTATRWFGIEWRHAGLRPGVTLHGLRHHRGSTMLQEGIPGVDVAADLGHSPQTLMTIYGRSVSEERRHQRLRETTERLYGTRT